MGSFSYYAIGYCLILVITKLHLYEVLNCLTTVWGTALNADMSAFVHYVRYSLVCMEFSSNNRRHVAWLGNYRYLPTLPAYGDIAPRQITKKLQLRYLAHTVVIKTNKVKGSWHFRSSLLEAMVAGSTNGLNRHGIWAHEPSKRMRLVKWRSWDYHSLRFNSPWAKLKTSVPSSINKHRKGDRRDCTELVSCIGDWATYIARKGEDVIRNTLQ